MTAAIFNDKVSEFLKELQNAYPEIDQFKRLKAAFNLLSSVQEDAPVKIFKRVVLDRFKDKILSSNEDFFLDYADYDGIENYSKRPEYWADFFEQLKSLWKDMSQDNKDAIWKYMKLLVLLGEAVGVR